MKNRIKKVLLFVIVLSVMLADGEKFLKMPNTVFAMTQSTKYNATSGMVSVGSGPCSIIIEGKQEISLEGKQFNVYKLLNYEKSDSGDSICYNVNPTYRDVLSDVVVSKYKAKGKNFNSSDMADEMIVDYIDSVSVEDYEKDDSEYRRFVEEVRTKLRTAKDSDFNVNIVSADSENKCKITGLDEGYYILDEVTNVSGKDTAASLCLVTNAEPDSSVHLKADYPSIIKKIKEDDPCEDILDSQGWNDIGDYEIGQNIPYKFESTVPDITGYSKYYYCWHDLLNPCIEFYKDTVSVVITGKTNDLQDKSYKLNTGEFNINEVNSDKETFSVEISDIKAIVDREFNSGSGIKKYGQKVTLNYTGALKNEAAEATGRPGFENEVFLEFSNDPDSDGAYSTGETKLDAVVCFTYRLNINKVNEKGDRLKGATFKLYRDKECTKEIIINKKGDKYVIKNEDSRVKEPGQDMITNANGEIIIAGLDAGTYYLKETVAPKGYSLILKPITITVTPKFTTLRDGYIKGDGGTEGVLVSLTGKAHVETYFRGLFSGNDKELTTNVNTGEVFVNVLNKTGKNLPKTGTATGIILFGTGSLCMVIALTLKSRNKKRR